MPGSAAATGSSSWAANRRRSTSARCRTSRNKRWARSAPSWWAARESVNESWWSCGHTLRRSAHFVVRFFAAGLFAIGFFPAFFLGRDFVFTIASATVANFDTPGGLRFGILRFDAGLNGSSPFG